MEPNFQTSFIPKKPIVKERAVRAPSMGLFGVIAFFIFFGSILVLGGAYLYRNNLAEQIITKSNDLEQARNRFEYEKLSQLQRLDRRLRVAQVVLSKHIAISPIFKDLSEITLRNIQYTNFAYELAGDGSSNILVKIKGISPNGYEPIAIQSDLFGQNKNFINPVFSNLSLTDKGGVAFDLQFAVDRSFVDYRQMKKIEMEDSNLDADTGENVFFEMPNGDESPEELNQIEDSLNAEALEEVNLNDL